MAEESSPEPNAGSPGTDPFANLPPLHPDSLPDFFHLDLDDADDLERFRACFLPGPDRKGRPSPVEARLLAVLRGGSVRCRSVILERNYVDRDFLAAYARVFARGFRAVQRECIRAHFFHDLIPSELLVPSELVDTSHSPAEGETHAGDPQQFLQDRYLGFSVRRPTLPGSIGRTVLSPNLVADQDTHVIVSSRHFVNLAGFALNVRGVPFTQQDQSISACATAALWMTVSALAGEYRLEERTTTALTELAASTSLPHGRVIPASGLTLSQISWAIKNVGLDPHVIDVAERLTSHEAQQQLYHYVESGLPVILFLQEQDGGHVVTAIGHTRRSSRYFPVLEQEPFYSSADWVDRFIIHDDSRGPYRTIRIQTRSNNPVLIRGDFSPLDENVSEPLPRVQRPLSPPIVEVDDPQTAPERSAFAALTAMVVPLPQGIFTLGEEAHEIASFFVDYAREEYADVLGKRLPGKLVLRTFLMRSNEFKELARQRPDLPPTVRMRYQGLRLPRHIWVSEVTCESLWDEKNRDELRVAGEVLMDATDNRRTVGPPNFLSFHLFGLFARMDPNQTAQEAIKHGLENMIVEGDEWAGPYKPLARSDR